MGAWAGGNDGALDGIVGCGKVKYWKILVTGSNGLIGSEAVEYFDRQGHKVVGVDNNMRARVLRTCRRHALESRTAQKRHSAIHTPLR